MDYVSEFLNEVTPGNYFLTKSMEISKVNTSGTLWYLKKFLVLYDAIFLSKIIRNPDGMTVIKDNFEKYIESLPDSQKEEAEKFFFPDNIDIRRNYRTYMQFAGPIEINHFADINQYMSLVDKYYFVYLMNIGGQSGVKAFLREQIYNTEFEVKNLNLLINQYKLQHPDENIDNNQIINDYHASLRNERQILFYFGFVHSRSNGAGNDREFASLTPIGELAVQSNSKEFALIWEHQKIKMVSQPVTVEIPSIRNCEFCDSAKFKINYSPYLTILKCMKQNGNLAPRFYDLVLSRTNTDNVDLVIDNYESFKQNLDLVKSTITGYGIRSDLASEDFEKEIKKYMLGIRSDLAKDNGDNYFGCVKSLTNDAWEITDKDKLNRIVDIYSQIDEYKIKRYANIFEECEVELRNKYSSTATGDNYNMNHRIKMSWDLYNIKKENIIMLSLVANDYMMNNQLNLENITDYNNLYEYGKRFFANVLKSINLVKKIDIINALKDVVERIKNHTLSDIEYDVDYSIDTVYVNRFTTLNSTDLLNKIKEISEENVLPNLERKRDGRIIGLLNSYYLANYSDENNLVACECCGQKTFIKNNDEPYLEYHHLIPFSIAGGPDHYENLFGICPMCHRKIHSIKDSLKEELYNGFDVNNHFHKNILDRLKDLYRKHILKSYQLEYALSEYIINEDEYNLILT